MKKYELYKIYRSPILTSIYYSLIPPNQTITNPSSRQFFSRLFVYVKRVLLAKENLVYRSERHDF